MVDTGYFAVSLGVESPVPPIGATDLTAFMEFFRQLTFIRMFTIAAIGFWAICFWAGSQLTSTQQASFLSLLAGVFPVMGAMAVAQQVAIWNRGTAGWSLVRLLGALLLTCLAAVFHETTIRRPLASG